MLDLSVELARLRDARQRLPNITNRHADFVARFDHALAESVDSERVTRDFAGELWDLAYEDVQRNLFDDRPLYWTRLACCHILKYRELDSLIPTFEYASRDFADQVETNDAEIVITGFDPFGLNSHIEQCNPSGLFALALHGTQIGDLRIRSLIFPVRYTDFDLGCVERVFTPILQSSSTKLVVTASMGRDGFDFERFPAKCRGSNQLDNQNVDITSRPQVFDPPLDGPSFVEFSLPVPQLLETGPSETYIRITDNRKVATIEDGQFEAASLNQLAAKQAIAGSGGNFLSNEIAYRTLRLQSELQTTIPMGHLHVPRITGFDDPQLREHFTTFKVLIAGLAGLAARSVA